jgi:hypothetical protein
LPLGGCWRQTPRVLIHQMWLGHAPNGIGGEALIECCGQLLCNAVIEIWASEQNCCRPCKQLGVITQGRRSGWSLQSFGNALRCGFVGVIPGLDILDAVAS